MFNYEQACRFLMLGGMLFLSLTTLACLVRIVIGPRLTDRIVATNMIGVKIMLLIILVGAYMGEGYLVDVALVYALLSFIAVIVFTRFVLQFKMNKQRKQKRKQK